MASKLAKFNTADWYDTVVPADKLVFLKREEKHFEKRFTGKTARYSQIDQK